MFYVCAGFWELEEHLADMFGLNDSKYQWAVDRYFEEKKDKDDRAAFEAEEEEERAEEENAKLAADARTASPEDLHMVIREIYKSCYPGFGSAAGSQRNVSRRALHQAAAQQEVAALASTPAWNRLH